MAKIKETSKVKGTSIKSINTSGSMYDTGMLMIRTRDGEEYRIKLEEVIGLLQKQNYTGTKAIKHTYLKVDGGD